MNEELKLKIMEALSLQLDMVTDSELVDMATEEYTKTVHLLGTAVLARFCYSLEGCNKCRIIRAIKALGTDANKAIRALLGEEGLSDLLLSKYSLEDAETKAFENKELQLSVTVIPEGVITSSKWVPEE